MSDLCKFVLEYNTNAVTHGASFDNKKDSLGEKLISRGAARSPHKYLGQKIVEKVMKLCKIGFSMECFPANFSRSCSTNVEICSLGGWLGACHQIQAFQEFSGSVLIPLDRMF